MTHNIYQLNIFCTELLNRPKFEVDPFPPGSQHHSTHSSRELRRSPWRFFLTSTASQGFVIWKWGTV
jgi:hypothetical protein